MDYSIYPKLRAIYSFFPTSADIEELLFVHGVSDFENRLTQMSLLQRFPLVDYDLETHLKMIPFSLARRVQKQIPEPSALFFDAYLRSYELKDIKNIIRGGKGFFTEELRDKRLSIEELNAYMQKKFWRDCWNTGYLRYKDRQDKIELEVPLDHFYYSSLLKETRNLPRQERDQTREFVLNLINFKNRLYLFRLKNFYTLEDFEIKRFLIPLGEVYENIEMQTGLSEDTFIREFTFASYKDFKFRMFTMRAILAFFFLFTTGTNKILSIYRAKLLHLEKEQLKETWSKIYVGS